VKRAAYTTLSEWKKRSDRKPLIVQGARQVGKTYLIKEFGTNEYENCVYINFEETPDILSLFDNNLSADKLIERISVYSGKKIESSKTLLVFDEIQVCQRALTSIKYFFEQTPQIHLIAAGSLLGVSIGKTVSFPVGAVEFLHLYPMSFLEFLDAFDSSLIKEYLISKADYEPIPEAFHNRLTELMKYYLYVGGMPEVVRHYSKNRDVEAVRHLQKGILQAYERDFSKYATASEAIKISEVWNSIPSQLIRENKKFQYGTVKKGSRASMFANAIEWLRKAGLILIAQAVTTGKLPLMAYTDSSRFKAYLLDCGLLGAMVNLESKLIVTGDKIVSEYNGAFIENLVATQLSLQQDKLYYWRSENEAEVDFVCSKDSKIIPLEVKSGMSSDAKSLRVFAQRYNVDKIYRTSPRNFTSDNDFVNIPLYAAGLFSTIC
jgi:predicted AAA+ superfamily ATPase